jgi:hypothetical protein
MKIFYLVLIFLLLFPFFLEVVYNRRHDECLKSLNEEDK